MRRDGYGWSFADVVANCAKALISEGKAKPKSVAFVLDSAIHAAVTKDQFSAMDKCRGIITSLNKDSYAMEVQAVLLNYPNSFVARINLAICKHALIASAIQSIKTTAED